MTTLEQVAQGIETLCNQHGWDQLPMLFYIKRGDDSFGVIEFDIIEGNIFEGIESAPIHKNADCVVLMTEGWTYSEAIQAEIQKAADFMVEHLGSDPKETMNEMSIMYYQYFPPSQDKNRVECRTVTAISLDEKPMAVIRKNDGSEPIVSDLVDGRVYDSLVAYITRDRA